MAFDTSGLSAYVEEQNFPLLTKALAGGRTAELITKQTGVKGETALNLMDVDAVMAQSGATCSFDATWKRCDILTKRHQRKTRTRSTWNSVQRNWKDTIFAANWHLEQSKIQCHLKKQFSNYLD